MLSSIFLQIESVGLTFFFVLIFVVVDALPFTEVPISVIVMAEAVLSFTSGSSDGEKDTNEAGTDESYRRLCEHYSRGCSFVVSSIYS